MRSPTLARAAVIAILAISGVVGAVATIAPGSDGQALPPTTALALLEPRIDMKSSVVRSSLFAAADAAGIPDNVAMQLGEVFGGDIDFHRDLRKGDRFTVVYKVHHLAGRPVRPGRMLAAEFVNQGRIYRAVHFGGRSEEH